MNMILAIASGGAIGAVLRYLLSSGVTNALGMSFPWGTLLVNVLGSFFMGVLVSYFMLTNNLSQEMRAFLTIGLLGAFTTFSTFSLDAVQLWERGAVLEMISYVAGSVILSIGGLILGFMLVRQFVS